jgi:hypothetical protein
MPIAAEGAIAAVESVTKTKEEAVLVGEESKVGKKLSDLITRRVIVLVLSMLLSVPVFSDTTYLADDSSFDMGLKIMDAYSPNDSSFDTCFMSFVNQQT